MWKDIWEQHAQAERETMDRQPLADLLDDARRGRWGNYYNLWDAIADRATLQQAGWILMDVLESAEDYLIRYHCAAALIKLMSRTDVEPVELSADWPSRPERLAHVKADLQQRAPRP